MKKIRLGIISFILMMVFIGCASEKDSFFDKKDFETFTIGLIPNKKVVSVQNIESFSLSYLIRNNYNKEINDHAEIYVNGNLALEENIIKNIAGEYTIYAKYKGVESEKIKVLVEEPKVSSIEINPDKLKLKSNGIDQVILEIQVKDQFGETMNSEPEIYANGTKILDNKFKTNIAGRYTINAKIGTIISEDIFIEVDKRIISKIELNTDKKKIIPNGKDEATLSYIVRDQYGNKMENEEVDIYINGNKYEELTFTTTEYSNYVIVAQYESILSNELVITSGQQSLADLTMITDKHIIDPDNNDKATFQFVLKDDNGLEIKDPSITVYLNEEEYNNTEFKTGEYGIYNFYAKSGDLISNTIKIEITSAILSEIELKANKTLIKPDNKDEIEFYFIYKDQFGYEMETSKEIELFRKIENSYEKINLNKFITNEKGSFEFYAQIEDIKSNYLIIRTIDSEITEIELRIFVGGIEVYEDDILELKDSDEKNVTYEYKVKDQFGFIIEDIDPILTTNNSSMISLISKSGKFNFKAKIGNLEESINIEVTQLINEIKLSFDGIIDTEYKGLKVDGIDEVIINYEVYDQFNMKLENDDLYINIFEENKKVYKYANLDKRNNKLEFATENYGIYYIYLTDDKGLKSNELIVETEIPVISAVSFFSNKTEVKDDNLDEINNSNFNIKSEDSYGNEISYDDYKLFYKKDSDINWIELSDKKFTEGVEGNYKLKIQIEDINSDEISIIVNKESRFAYVKGGEFNFGDEFAEDPTYPIERLKVDSLVASKYETTVEEYIEFLNENGVDSTWEIKSKEVIMIEDNKAIDYDFVNDYFLFNEVNSYNTEKDPLMSQHTDDGLKMYCNWMSKKEGLPEAYNLSGELVNTKGYRIPTEPEWEYLAKGGNKSKGYLYSGSDNPSEVAWYFENAYSKIDPFSSAKLDHYAHEVGLKAPNEVGMYDMSGNALEITLDWYNESSDRAIRSGHASYSSKQITNPYRYSAHTFKKGALRMVRTVD